MSESTGAQKRPQGLAVEVQIDGVAHRAALHRDGASGALTAEVNGAELSVNAQEIVPGVLSLLIGGRAYRCVLTGAAEERSIALRGRSFRVVVVDPRSLRTQRRTGAAGNGDTQVKASMPGRVARVLVAAGDAVEAHQGIVVIEAMKMQNELKAARAGRVAEIRVAAGDTVTSGQVLAVLE
jgi:biotin carboxyl carrier protein